MRRCGACLLIIAFVLSAPTAVAGSGETLDAEEVVRRVIAAAGGEAFSSLGILRFEIVEKELRNDGTQTTRSLTLFVDTANVNNLRMELPGDVVVAATKGGGWSTVEGMLDDRPQTPQAARKSLNQRAFPLLLPYSLKMEGVWLKEIREQVTDDGRKVWIIGIPFSKGFFLSPVLETTWILVVDQEDYSIVSLEFAPAPAYRDVVPVGVRYRVLQQKDLDGAKVISQLVAVGINSLHQESGATRVTEIESTVRGPRDATLFLSPQQVEEFEK